MILNDVPYEGVAYFKYLGSLVTYNNNIMVEIKDRIASCNHCLQPLANIMKDRYISKKVKIRICKTIIKSIVVYGSETCTLSEQAITLLATWERKIHRKIYAPLCDRGSRHIRTIEELKNLYQERDIVRHIKTLRLEWLGHLIRMQNIGIPKVALDTKHEGKRKVGRPKIAI